VLLLVRPLGCLKREMDSSDGVAMANVSVEHIEKCIEKVWKNEVKEDLEEDRIVYDEKDLVVSFCHHLRSELEEYHKRGDVVFITECPNDEFEESVLTKCKSKRLGGRQRKVDLCIGKWKNDRVSAMVALEFKYRRVSNILKTGRRT